MTAPAWADVEAALRFFGLPPDGRPELERIVVTYDLDADFDDDGQLLLVDVSDAREALFGEHERAVGFRPDDEKEGERERRTAERREERERAKRRMKRRGMAIRVGKAKPKRRWFRRKKG